MENELVESYEIERSTSPQDVVWLCSELDKLNIGYWLNGGWAVDALMGKQTRPHTDIDIFIQKDDLEKVNNFLDSEKFSKIPRNDETPTDFHVRDLKAREIDIHGIIIFEDGSWKFADPNETEIFPTISLSGKGAIEEKHVNTLSPEYIIKFHTGYLPSEKDIKDVTILCQKFNISTPEEFTKFETH